MIAAEVAVATILVWLCYARLVSADLDDAARIDAAPVLRVYLRIYLPLMAPEQFFDDDSPWNYIMAVAIIYSPAAESDLLCAPPFHGDWSDGGWHEGTVPAAGRLRWTIAPLNTHAFSGTPAYGTC